MARSAKFDSEQIIDLTTRLVARDGPAQATLSRIAAEVGAPTGSIYHRFASRDALLAEVWLAAAERFQAAFGSVLTDETSPWQAGLNAALMVSARARAHTDEARILMLHRRQDFVAGAWPDAVLRRAHVLKRGADQGLIAFTLRLTGKDDPECLRRIKFALIDVPLAAVLPHLRANEDIPLQVDALIGTCYRALIPLHPEEN